MVACALVLAASTLSLGACDGHERALDALSPDDSVGTLREMKASVATEPGAVPEMYTYRALFAGMRRDALEQQAPTDPRSTPPTCTPDSTRTFPAGSRRCEWDTRFARDSAVAHVIAVYATERGIDVAHDITILRPLPLDVDGMRLAGAIADAFERQTSILDRREQRVDRGSAYFRLTHTGPKPRFIAEITLAQKGGREQLTVHLSHVAAR